MFKRKNTPDLPSPPPSQDHSPLPPVHDESNWLMSYADMMTLLCGFFIMLFSMCKLDNPQYDSFKEALSKQFGGEYVSTTKELARFATQVLQELGIEKTVTIKTDAYGISLVFESTVFFDTLSADVTRQGKAILEKVISSILLRQKTSAKAYKIVVEGHTDSRPIIGGMYPSNWELSGARAARVVRLFLARGFPANHLTAIGYADTRPQVEARTSIGIWDDAALSKNRRVVLRILEPSADAIPAPTETPADTPPGDNPPKPSIPNLIPANNSTTTPAPAVAPPQAQPKQQALSKNPENTHAPAAAHTATAKL